MITCSEVGNLPEVTLRVTSKLNSVPGMIEGKCGACFNINSYCSTAYTPKLIT